MILFCAINTSHNMCKQSNSNATRQSEISMSVIDYLKCQHMLKLILSISILGFPWWLSGNAGDAVSIPGLGKSPRKGKGMATHLGILAQEIPWTKEPGVLQSTGYKSQILLYI